MHRGLTAAIVLASLAAAGPAVAECDYPAIDATFPLGAPTGASVVRDFGLQYDDLAQKKTQHDGVDFEAAAGDPVYAAQGGRVIEAGQKGDLGLYLRIDHGGGVQTGYGHLGQSTLKAGDCVTPGQEIGKAGPLPGPRLHFEVWRDGQPVNPLELLPQ
ncbi:MAG: M23 family metallopeptidase [Hyphomicrobium sp.]